MSPFDLIHWYWIKKLFCWNPTTFHPIESWFKTVWCYNVKLYHLYHCCKKKKIIIKKQSKSIDISLFCRSQLLKASPTELGKTVGLCRKCPRKCNWKKILVRNVVRVRNVAFLRNINYELLVRPLSRSIWCWFWKTGDPGSNPADVLNVSITYFRDWMVQF